MEAAAARFVLDVHLGRLAAYLRLAGFDTLYRNDYSDDELASIAVGETRILLTRDRVLRDRVPVGHFVRHTAPRRQLAEILRAFDLIDCVAPFIRCLRCNALLVTTPKAVVLDRLPPRVREIHDAFYCCPGCDRVYWRGTHCDAMTKALEQACFEARREELWR